MRRAARATRAQEDTNARSILVPTTDDELWHLVHHLWNIRIPRNVGQSPKCIEEGHVAPFTAFANAFFARDDIAIWHASRGLGGKSVTLATLALTEAVVLGAKVNLLGGSGEQSERVLNYMYGEENPDIFWGADGAPRQLIRGGFEKGALKKTTKLTNSGYIRALMASSRSVRGPHPERLRIDEADEMELTIYDAAMGQTMATRDIRAQTVASSTWHNADGTMTELMRRAADKDWPIYRWCMHENLQSNGGWLPEEEVARKRRETSNSMFVIEYELQEPNPESRAITPEDIEAMFDPELGEYKGSLDERIKLGKPEADKVYVTGTDWAKRKDYTIVWTFELTLGEDEKGAAKVTGMRMVEFLRTGRKPWPALISLMTQQVKRWGNNGAESYSCHDETGIGDVISDYMDPKLGSVGVWMAGRIRYEILQDYVTAIEHGIFHVPRIDWAYKEHLYASHDDLYGTGKTNHLPDTIAAGALAYYIAKNLPRRKKVRSTWGS